MRKRLLLMGIASLLIGSVGIHNIMRNAQFGASAPEDSVMLIASGLCLAVALIVFVRAGKRI